MSLLDARSATTPNDRPRTRCWNSTPLSTVTNAANPSCSIIEGQRADIRREAPAFEEWRFLRRRELDRAWRHARGRARRLPARASLTGSLPEIRRADGRPRGSQLEPRTERECPRILAYRPRCLDRSVRWVCGSATRRPHENTP